MVEESPGKLEYEVALFRESGSGVGVGGAVGGGGNGGAESPVDQAVPIGTKLQLRATIGANSGRYAFLNRGSSKPIHPIQHQVKDFVFGQSRVLFFSQHGGT